MAPPSAPLEQRISILEGVVRRLCDQQALNYEDLVQEEKHSLSLDKKGNLKEDEDTKDIMPLPALKRIAPRPSQDLSSMHTLLSASTPNSAHGSLRQLPSLPPYQNLNPETTPFAEGMSAAPVLSSSQLSSLPPLTPRLIPGLYARPSLVYVVSDHQAHFVYFGQTGFFLQVNFHLSLT